MGILRGALADESVTAQAESMLQQTGSKGVPFRYLGGLRVLGRVWSSVNALLREGAALSQDLSHPKYCIGVVRLRNDVDALSRVTRVIE